MLKSTKHSEGRAGMEVVIFTFSLDVHVLPIPQSHQESAELWKFAEERMLMKTLLHKGM